MHADGNKPIRSFETGGYNILLYYIPFRIQIPKRSWTGKTLSHHEFSSHAHSNVRRGYIECNKDGPHYASAFATYIRTQLAAFSIRCVVTTKEHTTLVNIWSRLHLYTQFAVFSFPTILPTANFALFSL